MAFISDQYLVIFFILALGLKLYFFNTYITKVTWSAEEYNNGIVCGYLSAAVLFSPVLLVRKYKNKIATVLAIIMSLIILVDILYYANYSSLPTIGLFNILGQTKDVGPAIGTLFHWTYLWFFADVAVAILLMKPMNMLVSRLKRHYRLKRSDVRLAWLTILGTLLFFWMSLMPVGSSNLTDVINMGFDTRTTSQPYGLLVAHAIDIARFIDQETTRLSTSQQKTLANWVKDNKPAQATSIFNGSAKNKNVIMIQVESLAGFAINQKINDREITPNLNKLVKESHFFPNDRYIYGAGHTSDTDFVSNSSYFPMSDAAVFVRFGHDDFTSLAKTLTSKGYSAYAYHGFNRDFWNRDVALKSLGYQKFYAADNYPKGEKINMGLNDGDFLSKTADYIKDQPKPSLSYVVTLSSHIPFIIPANEKRLNVKTSDYPAQVGDYLESINYTDRMLGDFFAKLKSNNLYDDSLILLYGDHNPVLPVFSAGNIKYDPEATTGKEVPLFIKLPEQTEGLTYPNKGSHLDITPTIFDLLGIKTNQLMFGQSLFASGDKTLKVCADQQVAFKKAGDCKSMLETEKLKSAEIIRYNQFSYLNRL